jgi:hypothetical protein
MTYSLGMPALKIPVKPLAALALAAALAGFRRGRNPGGFIS